MTVCSGITLHGQHNGSFYIWRAHQLQFLPGKFRRHHLATWANMCCHGGVCVCASRQRRVLPFPFPAIRGGMAVVSYALCGQRVQQ